MIAVIGGSGLSNINEWQFLKEEDINTPFGEPSNKLIFCLLRMGATTGSSASISS